MPLISYRFIAFVMIGLSAFYLTGRKHRWLILLALSLFFYGSFGWKLLVFPLTTSFITWRGALYLERLHLTVSELKQNRELDKAERKKRSQLLQTRMRRVLGILLAACFGILAVIKYTDFALSVAGRVINAFGIPGAFEPVGFLLPLGISYYSFQAAGYLIDVYRGKYGAEKSFFRLLLFILFFPQLISGPISRYDSLQPELTLAEPHVSGFCSRSAGRILLGLVKKLVIAERMSGFVMAVIASPETYGGIYAFLGMIGFTLWMYADFSGGIDIVLGTAGLFGIRLPENFNLPFTAVSLADFWTKWHMTLMQWMRDYVFYPCAVSKTAKRISVAARRLLPDSFCRRIPAYFASFTVWLVTGLWHGASERFLIWGMANFLVMTVSQELTPLYRRFHSSFHPAETRGWRVFTMVRTFLLFSFIEMFECYPVKTVFTRLIDMLTGFLPGRMAGQGLLLQWLDPAELFILFLGWTAVLITAYFTAAGNRAEQKAGWLRSWGMQYAYCFILLLLVLVFGKYGQGYVVSEFFYNQF